MFLVCRDDSLVCRNSVPSSHSGLSYLSCGRCRSLGRFDVWPVCGRHLLLLGVQTCAFAAFVAFYVFVSDKLVPSLHSMSLCPANLCHRCICICVRQCANLCLRCGRCILCLCVRQTCAISAFVFVSGKLVPSLHMHLCPATL
jgi:hypothetical protein